MQQIELGTQIGQRVAKSKGKVSIGQAVQAMVINALGFVECSLYLMPEFYSNKPAGALVGTGLEAAGLNDDCLGRVLDRLFEAGVTEVFAGYPPEKHGANAYFAAA